MTQLQFIDANPATEAYQKGQQAAAQQMESEVRMQGETLRNVEGAMAAPSRLRSLSANADYNVTRADVARQTAPSDVSKAQSAASFEATRASEAAATSPYNVRKAAAGAGLEETRADVAHQTAPADVSKAQSQARQSGAQADVAERTTDTKVEKEKSGLRQTDLANEGTQMKHLHDILDLAEAGRVDDAKRMDAASGHPEVPDQVWQDKDLLAGIRNGAAYAEKTYPNNPKKQWQWMTQTWMPYVKGVKEGGGRASDPGLVQSAGMPQRTDVAAPPEPPEVASGLHSGQTERIISNLMAENPSLTYHEAVALAKRAPNDETLRREALALSAAKAENGYQRDPVGTIEKHRHRYGLPPMAPPPEVGPKGSPGFWNWLFGGNDTAPAQPPAAPQQPAGGLRTVAPPTAPAAPVAPPAAPVAPAPPPVAPQTAPVAPTPSAAMPPAAAAQPPEPGAQQAPDGLWYIPDPDRPGKYIQVIP